MLHRRALLGAIAATGLAGAGSSHAAPTPAPDGTDPAGYLLPQPVQAPARCDYVTAPGAYLYFRDTQGAGTPVIFLHPLTGDVESWAYQQPVFAAAGYRVIAYARRGFNPSQITDPSQNPTEAEDLLTVITALQLKRVHLVGAGAGALVAADFAADHANRQHSLTLADSLIAPDDPLVQGTRDGLTPKEFLAMPAQDRELGPSYRAVNKDGVARWIAIEQTARAGQPAAQRSPFSTKPPSILTAMPDAVPKLLLTGSADAYMPPALLQQAAAKVQNAEVAVIQGAGRASFWEQPSVFNRAVLDFIARHNA
jgi:pimeloyl-ACP methyl ester carboxylesterase